ncbi:MAG: OB-fold domain-containing protein [Actinomycetota bacterium]|nr:OB-fold domain-containing protein [Actinomycetota bacterium]
MSDRFLPSAVGLTGEFYAFLARGELRLQRCAACGSWRHPPRHRCAHCGSVDATWEPATGRGRVFSWTVTHRAVDPAFTPPYAILVVELAEGPRLVGNLRGLEPSELLLDLPVTVEIEHASDTVGLLWFRPASPE